jgi:hypothetical protein
MKMRFSHAFLVVVIAASLVNVIQPCVACSPVHPCGGELGASGLTQASRANINPVFFGVNMADQPNVDAASLVGANMSRYFCFWWCFLEPENGTWNFTTANEYVAQGVKDNLTMFGMLICPPSWVVPDTEVTNATLPLWLNYVDVTVTRYMSQVRAWEIWNEPDQPMYWSGTLQQFYYVQEQTALLIKAIDPTLTVIAGASAFNKPSYLDNMISYTGQPAFNRLFDAVAVHMYFNKEQEQVVPQLAQIETTLFTDHGYNGTIWITEIGYPTEGPYSDMAAYEQDLDVQADAVVKVFCMTLADPHVASTVWFMLWDPEGLGQAWQSWTNFGLLYGDSYQMKPSAFAYRLLSAKLANGALQPSLMHVSGSGLDAQYIYFYCFTTAANETLLVLWDNFAAIDVSISCPAPVAAFDEYSTYDDVILPINCTSAPGFTYSTTIDNSPKVFGINSSSGEVASVIVSLSPTPEDIAGWIVLPVAGLLAIAFFLSQLRSFRKRKQ